MAWLLTGALQSLSAAPDSLSRWSRHPVFVVNEENDLFVNTDRHYTQGLKVAFIHRDGDMPLGMESIHRWLPAWGFQIESGRSGYAIGQNMYTPADVSLPTLIPGDRPYAGWLHIDWILHRSGHTRHRDIPVQESWELELGVKGSPSLARQAQKWVHDIRGFDPPQGWGNQLRDEPGFRLKYERAYRLDLFGTAPGLQGEFIPWSGAAVGTVEDSLRAGGVFRLGVGLPNDFGVRTIDGLSTTGGGRSDSDGRSWGMYGFLGMEGRLVAWNAFLDGNLYREGHNINKRFSVGDLIAGFVVVVKHLETGYTHVFRTPEFEGQTQHNQFGSIYFKLRF